MHLPTQLRHATRSFLLPRPAVRHFYTNSHVPVKTQSFAFVQGYKSRMATTEKVQQPAWVAPVPETPEPKLKVWNSLTRTKVRPSFPRYRSELTCGRTSSCRCTGNVWTGTTVVRRCMMLPIWVTRGVSSFPLRCHGADYCIGTT